jgi:soluble lytic murein transglycosylase-like protein
MPSAAVESQYSPARRARGARFPVALIAAALLAGGTAHAQGPGQRVVPLPPMPTLLQQQSAVLPNPLSADDSQRYHRIFAAQARRDVRAADQEVARLGDRRLLGHVLAQRYLAERANPSYAELAQWMQSYADHPDAMAIYQLAERKRPRRNAAALRRPAAAERLNPEIELIDDLQPPPEQAAPPGRANLGAQTHAATALMARLRARVRTGRASELEGAAEQLRHAESRQLLSEGQIDFVATLIAASWMAESNDARALELAQPAAQRSGALVPRATWIAGLAFFKQGRFAEAARSFEAMARVPGLPSWDRSGAAFWAARSFLRAREPARVNPLLQVAAEQPRTFYGLLAIRLLGLRMPFNFDPPPFSPRDAEVLLGSPAGTRALALIQVGEVARAEAEIRRLGAAGGRGLTPILLAVAMRASMPNLSMRLGRELLDSDGTRYVGALYPIPRWEPPGGFSVDPALVFAFMRQESAFNPTARSSAGARGLMQLMPNTAAGMRTRALARQPDQLYDPELNLDLGQRFIAALLEYDGIEGNMIRLAAAYNGGPGNLQRWTRNGRGETNDDALLFMESVPAAETRHFISRVLYNYWMYSEQFGAQQPTLDQVASGQWPIYYGFGPRERTLQPTQARNAPN